MAKNSLKSLLKNMSPELNSGDFVFVSVQEMNGIDFDKIVAFIREKEGFSMVLSLEKANQLGLSYSGIFSWITLNVFSGLDDVGLTAAFSTLLANNNISCNAIAGINHDHIFVPKTDTDFAMKLLLELSS